MTQYLLAVHHDWQTPSPPPEEMEAAFAAVERFNQKLEASGALVFAGGLEPPDRATVVHTKGGRTVTTDGPYAETKEQLGGFWVIEAADGAAAVALASEASEACREPVELRPFQAEPDD